MKSNAPYSLSINAPGAKNQATTLRKRFNGLVKKTETARRELAAWKEAMPTLAARAENELQPLVLAFAAQQREMVLLLDAMHRDKLKGKKERAKLSELICSIAAEVLGIGDDAEVQALFERHGGEGEGDDPFMALLADALDMEIDDVRGMQTPEEFLAALHARQDGDNDVSPADSSAKPAGKSARRKTAAALAREEREAAEAARLRQPVRDIFRKLSSELHPDREPDGAERARKTELMQRVNVAYKANDLLALLELQLEIAQIGQSDMDTLGEDRIKLYNKILDTQLREIQDEIGDYERQAYMTCAGRMHGRATPQALTRFLEADMALLRQQIKTLAAEIETFKDPAALKAFLKTWEPPADPAYPDDYWF